MGGCVRAALHGVRHMQCLPGWASPALARPAPALSSPVARPAPNNKPRCPAAATAEKLALDTLIYGVPADQISRSLAAMHSSPLTVWPRAGALAVEAATGLLCLRHWS